MSGDGDEEATERTPLVSTSQEASGCGDAAFRVRLLTAVASLAEGYDIGVTNGVVVLMQDELGLSPTEVGIAIGVTPLMMALFALIAGSVADAWGRKPAICLSACMLVIGNIFWALATSFEAVVIGRAFLGAGIGVGLSTVTMYMSEVAPAATRGMYVSLEELFLNVGILSGFAMNALLIGVPHDWRIMVGLGALPASVVVLFLLTPYFPESPRFLHAAGRHDLARKTLLELLHGDRAETDAAFAAWELEAKEQEASGGDSLSSWPGAMKAFVGNHRASALAGIGCGVFQLMGGISILTVYSSFLLMRSGGLSLQESTRFTLFIGIVKTLAILVVSFHLLDNWGRRPLLLLSAAICTFATAVVGLSHLWGWGAMWLVGGLSMFAIGFSLGMGPVTYAYIAEVFSNELRGKGVALALFWSRLIAAIYIFSVPMARIEFGLARIFLFLSAVNAVAFGYYWAFCPETMGVKLEDMQDYFRESPWALSGQKPFAANA